MNLDEEYTEKAEILSKKRECRGVLWQWRGSHERALENRSRAVQALNHWGKRLKKGSYRDWIKITRDSTHYRAQVGSLGSRLVHRETRVAVEQWRDMVEMALGAGEKEAEGAEWHVKRQTKEAWEHWRQRYVEVTSSRSLLIATVVLCSPCRVPSSIHPSSAPSLVRFWRKPKPFTLYSKESSCGNSVTHCIHGLRAIVARESSSFV